MDGALGAFVISGLLVIEFIERGTLTSAASLNFIII